MTKSAKANLLKWSALGIDVGAPLVTTMTQFPAWTERSSGATVSGLFVVFALVSAIPLFNKFKDLIKTPSIPFVWAIACAILLCLRSIVDEMVLICFVGAISNALGAVMYKIGENMSGKDDENGSENQ